MLVAACFTRLFGAPEDIEIVDRVLSGAPRYAQVVHGGPFGPDEAESVFRDLPPKMSADAKRVFGIGSGGADIGVVEFVVGYPEPRTLMLGLLVLDEKWQGRGLGGQSVVWLERHAAEVERCTRVRLGVVRDNVAALGFWKSRGYSETGEIKAWSDGTVESEVIVFEKALAVDA